jgi:aspartyl-tRNA(Asn)/glutamyl-tRNA(Gln) amidotransferase subunit B
MAATEWEAVIGLEIHIHLKTRTKMFCRCELAYGAEPNTHTCPVCLAHPGALPVPNRTAIEWTIKLGHALSCRIADRAVFARKNYFYPDLPKGYQISQYDEPLCIDGTFAVPEPDGDRHVGIVRAHLEEDAAKTVHVGGTSGRTVGAAYSLVDFNRGGTPLVEIVTQPDLRSADDARRFLELLRQTIVELGISDAEMEKGTLRCDVNVSVRPHDSGELRTRWELKNMNSFRFVARGIDAAVREQIEVYERGDSVDQHTYDYNADNDTLTIHRTKEEADDYRYFPEPDLVPVEPPAALVDRLRDELPELPAARIRRLQSDLEFELAHGLVTSGRAGLYERLLAGDSLEPRVVANAVMNEIAGAGIDPEAVNAPELAKVLAARERLPRDVYAQAIAASATPAFAADDYLTQTAVSDEGELDPIVESVLAANPQQVETYRSGKEGVLGFLVGQVMKETQGKADPKVVNRILREKLQA